MLEYDFAGVDGYVSYWGDAGTPFSPVPSYDPNMSGGGLSLPDVTIQLPSGSGGAGRPDLNQTLTQIVNSAEATLKMNLAAWQSQQLSASDAVARAWQVLNGMVSQLLQFGAQGQNSAAERDRRIDPTRLRWDWIAYYIDPITGGSTALQPLPTMGGGVPLSQAGPGLSSFSFGQNTELILMGLALLALVWLSRNK